MGYMDQYMAAKNAGTTAELTATFHEFSSEQSLIVGKLTGRYPVKGKQNAQEYNHYIMATDDGNVKFFCGSVFDKEVGNAMVMGGVYAIEYLGQDDIGGGKKVNKFSCELVSLPAEDG